MEVRSFRFKLNIKGSELCKRLNSCFRKGSGRIKKINHSKKQKVKVNSRVLQKYPDEVRYTALPLIRPCVSPDSAVLRTLDSALT